MHILRSLVPGLYLVSSIIAVKIPLSTRDAAPNENIGEENSLPQLKPESGVASWESSLTPSQYDEAARQALAKRQETPAEVQRYAVVPRDGKDSSGTTQTEQLLQKLVGSENVNKAFVWKEAVQWWACNMTSEQVDEAGKYEGVRSIERIAKSAPMHSIPPHTARTAPILDKYPASKLKRDASLLSQNDAVAELIAVSQPSTIPDIKKLKHYVHDSDSGKNSFIYHIGAGVNYKKHANEFSNLVPDDQHLQISRIKDWGLPPWVDHSLDMHSTCTANKAVGTNYGASKHAKLVVVKMFLQESDEIIEALAEVAQDIRARPERRKKSVVTMSMGLTERNPFWGDKLSEVIRDLFKLDVPVIVPAGNEAGDPNRQHVDSYPALFSNFNFPLVVVGSADYDGSRSPFSQAGPHLTVHAVGNGVTCLPNDDSTPVSDRKGTSFAAPVVAAQAANLLSYDTVPFDTSDGDLVANLWSYLQSPASSWARVPGVSMIWNGVQENNNPAEAAPPPSPPPPPPPPVQQCNGVASKKYVTRDTVAKNVLEFCSMAIKQGGPDPNSGSIGREFNTDTVEQLTIYLDIPPGSPMPSEEDCKTHLLSLVDNCDGNDPQNPKNYKAGGSLTIGTNVYHITPIRAHKPMPEDVKVALTACQFLGIC
ncbi:Subtilisin-like protein [Glarea lozoyensis ATCC 20868]|uniref:Subtilisin-like protein n=1 Tax=Glarea lozoyensis (strain ATCC 20868 / MF5171) TaxID=1116229 RepID=S3CFU0_GLAL2|nr:Subtilisin-like protein [Glarea lozoyensis ATCC 20868]EPE25367.1 Subtilisin-like protein [Glarea lozoyensis ATCC 20868]